MLTHRLVNLLASYASRKRRWWWSGWWSQPGRRGAAIREPGGCGPSAPTSPRGCRTCWWRCIGTRLDLNRCPGWKCGARCSCLCCWWRNGRWSCRFPTEGGDTTRQTFPTVILLWVQRPLLPHVPGRCRCRSGASSRQGEGNPQTYSRGWPAVPRSCSHCACVL